MSTTAASNSRAERALTKHEQERTLVQSETVVEAENSLTFRSMAGGMILFSVCFSLACFLGAFFIHLGWYCVDWLFGL